MSLVYAPRGLLGVLTPQSNTTVEPEFQILCPPGVTLLAARMTSSAADLQSRLCDYYEHLPRWIAEFAHAPLGAVASACTGASYLMGAEAEDRLFTQLSHAIGRPVTNSALAVVAAMRCLGVRRMALVSPYPAWLTANSQAYWESRDLQVRQVVQMATDSGAFHPIYALESRAAEQAIAEVRADVDAVLLLGTGMPTLPALARHPQDAAGRPILSCNLALLWHALEAMHGHHRAPRRAALLGLLNDRQWRARLRAATLGPSRHRP